MSGSGERVNYQIRQGKSIERKMLCDLIRSVYKELHADHETGAADNK